MPQATPTSRLTLLGCVACAVWMIAQQVAAKAIRDTLFLDVFGATRLPLAMGGSALLSIALAVGWGRLLARVGPARLVPALFVLHGVAFTVEWLLLPIAPDQVTAALYPHTTVVGGLVVSGFWSVLNERFDPHAGKLMMGRAAAGAALGGVLGGTGAHLWSQQAAVGDGLVVLAVLNVLAALSLWTVSRGVDAPAPEVRGRRSNEPYLRSLAMLVALTAGLSALADWTFKSAAAEAFTQPASLMSFFALFYTVTSVLAFALSAGASRTALATLGLVGTMALLPGLMGLSAALALATGSLWALLLLSGTEETLSASLYRAGYEALYTPLPARAKRASKVWLDVAFKRLGSAFASGLIGVAVWVAGTVWAQRGVLALCVVLAAALLWLMRVLNRGYVKSLVHSLRAGTVSLEDSDSLDATTRRTLVDTTQALDRSRLLEEIASYRERQDRPGAPGQTGSDLAAVQPLPGPVQQSLRELSSDDPTLAARALARRPLDRRVVPLVIDWLDHPQLGTAAQGALQSAAHVIAGQLSDALLDEGLDAARRARVALCFHERAGKRAVEGLVAALSSPSFTVRHGVGLGLDRLRRAGVAAPDEQVVVRAVLSELRVEDAVWHGRTLEAEQPDARGASLSRRHVFRLLGLVYGRDAVRASLVALEQGAGHVRGTSLEYLDAVLPSNVRDALWPRLKAEPMARPRRAPEQLAQELLLSTADARGDSE